MPNVENIVNSVQFVAIVNSFNRLELFRQSLPSLVAALESCTFRTAIVIFEAGSTDGSLEWLEEYSQHYLNSPQDRQLDAIHVLTPGAGDDTSFSAGVNAGCQVALERYPELKSLFLFETDNWIGSPRPLELALRLMKRDDRIAAVGFTVKNHQGQPVAFGQHLPSVLEMIVSSRLFWSKPISTLRRHLTNRQQRITGWQPFEDTRRVNFDVVYTSPLAIERSAWEMTGGMDSENFPFSDCDIDWAWQLKKAGKIMSVLEVDDVVHDNRAIESSWSQLRVLRLHQARCKLIDKHYGSGTLFAIKPLLFVRHAIELLFCAVAPVKIPDRSSSVRKRWLLLTTVFNNYQLNGNSKST